MLSSFQRVKHKRRTIADKNLRQLVPLSTKKEQGYSLSGTTYLNMNAFLLLLTGKKMMRILFFSTVGCV